MKISDIGEFGLIRNIQRLFSRRSPSTLIGIGDDSAVLRISPSAALLATTDMLLENVHFDLSYTDFYSLGWKSAAVNLSDIAAMGGTPRFLLSALGLPSHITPDQIREFYRGLRTLAEKYQTELIGGDTCRSSHGLVVSITALGELAKANPATRSGAIPGDFVFVTGTLGDAAAGLEILKGRVPGQGVTKYEKKLVQKHLRPVPQVKIGQALARAGCAGAMIDVSDGLSSDLGHICSQSRVGAEIVAAAIPISPDLLRAAEQSGKAPLEYALSGGEDYELLFTVPAAKIKKLRALRLNIPITEIGRITRGRKPVLRDRDGKISPLTPGGYDHFRPS